MFFKQGTPLLQIQSWVSTQLSAVCSVAKQGVDVEIRPHRNPRSTQQNRFLMAILVALVRFYHETGFIPTGLSPWAMRTDILKEFYKAKFGILHTHKLSTSEFSKFVDGIQFDLVEQTCGEWQILQPDSVYMKSLEAYYG